MRPLPAYSVGTIPDGYGKVVAQGYDTIEETMNIGFEGEFIEQLEDAKARAIADEEEHPGEGSAEIAFGNEFYSEVMRIAPHGAKGGTKWILTGDDFYIGLRSEKSEWNVSVHYLAVGLWRYGVAALRTRVFNALCAHGKPRGRYPVALRRVDFAVDIYSPAFSPEMKRWGILDQILAPVNCKRFPVGTGKGLETITIGSKNGVQVQLYDKGLEIREASGKEWMAELWAQRGYQLPADGKARDVWRLECRFTKDFLRDRGVITFQEFDAELKKFMAEALVLHRLAVPRDDSNRARWPTHPLWQMAIDAAARGPMPELGRRFTMKRVELVDMLKSQAAGVMRAVSVLEKDDFTERDAWELSTLVRGRLVEIAADKSKVPKLRERYAKIDEMR